MDGANSNMLTQDDISRAFSMVKVDDQLEQSQGQQPYMLKDEATMMEEDGALFGNGASDEGLFDFQPDDATVTDDISDSGVYQEDDVGQFVTDQGDMEPLPDPAFYAQTSMGAYSQADLDRLSALAAQAESAEQTGSATGEQVDTAAAAAEAAAVAKSTGETGTGLIASFKAAFDASKLTRTAARNAGAPIPATVPARGFFSKYGVWIAIVGLLGIGGGAAYYYTRKRGA